MEINSDGNNRQLIFTNGYEASQYYPVFYGSVGKQNSQKLRDVDPDSNQSVSIDLSANQVLETTNYLRDKAAVLIDGPKIEDLNHIHEAQLADALADSIIMGAAYSIFQKDN